MNEAGEHHAPNHPPKEGDFSLYVLPLSILLAAVILGYSVVSAANTLGDGLSTLTIAGGGGTVLPTPDPGQGDLAPTPQSNKTLAELSSTNFAGKLGSDSAPVIMIEYSDFQCPFCKRFFNDSFVQLKQWTDEGKISLVFKDYPLPFHSLAVPSASAARCAGEQEKFWEMHDKIFEETTKIDPSGTSQYTEADLTAWATDVGLDMTAFNTCFSEKKYAAGIQANQAEGQEIGVGGTPSFAIGKPGDKVQLVVGACPTSAFEQAITAAAEGKKWYQVPSTCTIVVN
jgi:protein-disulfide isomerase